jgi:hypothetical protein
VLHFQGRGPQSSMSKAQSDPLMSLNAPPGQWRAGELEELKHLLHVRMYKLLEWGPRRRVVLYPYHPGHVRIALCSDVDRGANRGPFVPKLVLPFTMHHKCISQYRTVNVVMYIHQVGYVQVKVIRNQERKALCTETARRVRIRFG